MKICSLLPSSTEILYTLGLGDQLVAVTHECDYPPEAAAKPHIRDYKTSTLIRRFETRRLLRERVELLMLA